MSKNENIFEVTRIRNCKKDVAKKLCALSLAAFLSVGSLVTPVSAATRNNPDVLINDAKVTYRINEYPFYSESDNCTYIPLSTLGIYGYKSYWDKNTLYTTSEYGTLAIIKGEKSFTFNNKKYEMAGALKEEKGVLYVPVIVISTVTNAKTEWNTDTYRINFVTNEKKVDEQRLTLINARINNNNDLTYQEKQTIKSYVEKYMNLIEPTLDEVEDMCEVLSKLDIKTYYNGINKPVYTIKDGIINYNASRSSKVSKDDAVVNALTSMFNETTKPLFNGIDELLSAEITKTNTNQNHAMVIVSKMLSDIIGKDNLLQAYRTNNMSVIKKSLMDIYNDEALYNNFETLLDRLERYDNAYYNGLTISNLSKSKQERLYKEDVRNIYGILDVYYQCKFGYEIIEDDVMEGHLNELLTHGDMKSFKYEKKVFVDGKDLDYTVIYRTPQTGYNRGVSTYNYYDSYRPINGKGNGQVLALIK